MDQFVSPVPGTNSPDTVAPAKVRKDVANIFFILDKSGSMEILREQVVSGYNSFMKDQREKGGQTRVTFIQFNESRHVIFEGADINSVPDLSYATFQPDGTTALNDAVGFVVTQHLNTCSDDETNIIAILTDGAENSSKEYTGAQVKELLARAQAKNWEVLFLGANMRADTVINNYGIAANNVAVFQANAKGAADAFSTLSASTTGYRGLKSAGLRDAKLDVQAVYTATAGASDWSSSQAADPKTFDDIMKVMSGKPFMQDKTAPATDKK